MKSLKSSRNCNKSIGFRFAIFPLVLFYIAACQQQDLLSGKYNLQQPDKVIRLPKTLTEISGLADLKNGRLAAIQDEKGILFVINVETGEIESTDEFGKNGDYEGLTIVEDNIYCVESTGKIHEISLTDKTKVPEKYKTWLSSKNNVEGLCYHKTSNSLLLVCKEQSGRKKHKKSVRGIYAFNLQTKKLKKQAFFNISETEIGQMLDDDMCGYFQPSGIAISPINNKVYIISSVGNAIAVYSEAGQLEQVLSLSNIHFTQPEGIVFDVDGTLYIANEGRGSWGNILVFQHFKN